MSELKDKFDRYVEFVFDYLASVEIYPVDDADQMQWDNQELRSGLTSLCDLARQIVASEPEDFGAAYETLVATVESVSLLSDPELAAISLYFVNEAYEVGQLPAATYGRSEGPV
jgi:hypothetical protein